MPQKPACKYSVSCEGPTQKRYLLHIPNITILQNLAKQSIFTLTCIIKTISEINYLKL